MNNLTIAQIAWLSGFFDGEGCVCIYLAKEKPTQLRPKGRQRYAMQISLTNVCAITLQLVASWYGGHVQKHSGGCWVWKLCDRDSQRRFLLDVLPYSKIKTRQIQVGLEYLDTVLDYKKYGYHPIDIQSSEIREKCYRVLQDEKDKYSTSGIHRIGPSKTSETAGNPERAICNETSKEGRSETIMEVPKGNGIVRHSEESEITDATVRQ